ncbi:hypothetical protein GPECTOR_19g235 [Gonium pectorale]|uniref:Uncharacterized protein n=1 Tax=Gonium pectorale TaxID=33097 RepID=A0A150GJ36_GONPE|nr:hypothetical protein GPECTOR_19g235 [Gonium pectorale]|eukprot:KXZ49784.1 hypothetical protein GPECTOR_19g235 [Gonium pectorale]
MGGCGDGSGDGGGDGGGGACCPCPCLPSARSGQAAAAAAAAGDGQARSGDVCCGCAGCGAEGILIPAGGPRLLTNLVVLLRVLRLHLNCSLPVEVAWAGPGEMGGAEAAPPAGRQPRRGNGTGGRSRGCCGGVCDGGCEDSSRGGCGGGGGADAPFIRSLRAAGLGPVYGLDLSSVPYPEHHRRPRALTHWGAKVFALLASCRFRRVLLLDADALPLSDPRVTMFSLLPPLPPTLPAPDFPADLSAGRPEAVTEPLQPPVPTHLTAPAGIAGGEQQGGGCFRAGGGEEGEVWRPGGGGVLLWPDAWRGWARPGAFRELGLDELGARLALRQLPAEGQGTRNGGEVELPDFVAVSNASAPGRRRGRSSGGAPLRWPRRDAESGAVLIDVAAHADVLEYLWWINSFGDRLYHSHLHGDKDTFALAFAAAGKAHCYSQVDTPPGEGPAARGAGAELPAPVTGGAPAPVAAERGWPVQVLTGPLPTSPGDLHDARLAAALAAALLAAPATPSTADPDIPATAGSGAPSAVTVPASPPLPSWEVLHAALLAACLTDDRLEQPYTPPPPPPPSGWSPPPVQAGPLASPSGHAAEAAPAWEGATVDAAGPGDGGAASWPPPPPPLAGMAVCVAAPVPAALSDQGAEVRCAAATTAAGQGGGHGEPAEWRRLAVEPPPPSLLPRPREGPAGAPGAEAGSAVSISVPMPAVAAASGGAATAVLYDDSVLAAVAAAYREHEWVLAAAGSGHWPELVQTERRRRL